MLAETDRAELIEALAKSRTGEGLGDVLGLEAHRRSPACGDDIRVRVVVDRNRIVDLRWEGHGCVISTAAASALAATASGLDLDAFRALADRYLLTLDADATSVPVLDDLEAFAGIGRYPLRAGCASLAWRATLEAVA